MSSRHVRFEREIELTEAAPSAPMLDESRKESRLTATHATDDTPRFGVVAYLGR
jgi:hypothetical protein